MNERKRIEIFRAGVLKRQWAFRFIAANGEKVAASETYKNKLDAIAAANKVKAGYSKVPVTVEGEEADRTMRTRGRGVRRARSGPSGGH